MFEDLENINKEKDLKITLLTEKLEVIEEKVNQTKDSKKSESEKTIDDHLCEYCQFSAKNERGLQLHIKAKHDVKKVEINVCCKATDEYLSIDRDEYRKQLESEIYVLEDVIDMYIDASGKTKEEYVGKLLPTKIVLRTRIPLDWESESFRNNIWKRINDRLSNGKICEASESD